MLTAYHANHLLNKIINCLVYGIPPAGNANYAWVQRFTHHLAPHGMAGFVLAVTASLNHSFGISGL